MLLSTRACKITAVPAFGWQQVNYRFGLGFLCLSLSTWLCPPCGQVGAQEQPHWVVITGHRGVSVRQQFHLMGPLSDSNIVMATSSSDSKDNGGRTYCLAADKWALMIVFYLWICCESGERREEDRKERWRACIYYLRGNEGSHTSKVQQGA